MGEGINNLITGYMDGHPPPGPADLGRTGTVHNPETGEVRPLEEVVPNRLYNVGPLRMNEAVAARLTYLLHHLGLSTEEERQGILERLLSAAADDALWEYARQAGKSQQEVYTALLRMHPRQPRDSEGPTAD